MKMKRIMLVSVMFLSGVILFAGSGADKAAVGSQEPVILRFMWWGGDSRHQITLKAIDRYAELNPNITIEAEYSGYGEYLQKIMTQIAGRAEPDIMQLSYTWRPELAARGDIFVDFSKEPGIDLSSYNKRVLEEFCSYNGKLMSLPMGTNGWGIMLNKSFFARHNIPLDTEWTWQKVLEEGTRVHKANPDDYLTTYTSGAYIDHLFSPYLYSKNGYWWIDDADGSLHVSKNDLVEFFTFLKALYDNGAIEPLGEANLTVNEESLKWINGNLGFRLAWAGVMETFKAQLKDPQNDFAVAKAPYTAGGKNKGSPFNISMVLAVSNRSANVSEAVKFANWILDDPEAILMLGTSRSVPTSTKALDILKNANAVSPEMAQMVAATNADPFPPFPDLSYNSEIMDIVKDICEQVVFGKLNPSAAADKFLVDIQAKLDSLKRSR
jgi:oligogalacturonide transport system substrate-binding protein